MISLLIICTVGFNAQGLNAALGLHSNFAEAITDAIRSRIYVESSYTIPALQATPTCSSIIGAICRSIQASDRPTPELPVLSDSITSSVSTFDRRQTFALEDSLGEDTDPEGFKQFLIDGISWLLSQPQTLISIWSQRKELEESASFEPFQESTVNATRWKISFKEQSNPTAFEGPLVRKNELSQLSEVRWWNPFSWVKVLDPLAMRFARRVMESYIALDDDSSDYELSKEEEEVNQKPSWMTPSEEFEEISEPSSPEQSDWAEKKVIQVDMNTLPLIFYTLPEYFGSSDIQKKERSKIRIRWIGDFSIIRPVRETKSVEKSETRQSTCAAIDSNEAIIAFDVPVVLTDLFVRKVPPRRSIVNITKTKDDNNNNNNHNNHNNNNNGFQIEEKNRELLSIMSESNWTGTRVFFEGWFWEPDARKAFLSTKTTEIEKRRMISDIATKKVIAWTAELSLNNHYLDGEEDEGKNLNEEFIMNTESINVVNRIQGSPYIRIDGLTISYALSKIEYEEKENTASSDDSFLKFKRTILPKTRLQTGPRICIERLRLNHLILKKNKTLQDEDTYMTGIILKEISLGEINSKDIYSDILHDNHLNNYDPIEKDRIIHNRRQYKKFLHNQSLIRRLQSAFLNPSFLEEKIIATQEIASDGILLNPDFRFPMQKYILMLQERIPKESNLISLNDLNKNDLYIKHKPESPAEGSHLIVPVRLSYTHEMEFNLDEEIERQPVGGALLKRKLIDAARMTLESLRISQNHHRHSDSLGNKLTEAISVPLGDNLDTVAVSTEDRDSQISVSTLEKHLSQSLKQVLKDFQQTRGDTPADSSADLDVYKNIDIVELFEKDGKIMMKKIRVDLNENEKTTDNNNNNLKDEIEVSGDNVDDSLTKDSTLYSTVNSEKKNKSHMKDLNSLNRINPNQQKAMQSIMKKFSAEQNETIMTLLSSNPKKIIADAKTGTINIEVESINKSNGIKSSTIYTFTIDNQLDNDSHIKAHKDALKRHHTMIDHDEL